MTTRKYSSRSQQTTLTAAVTSGATVIPVANATTLFGGATVSTGQTFTIVIDPDTALEEIVEITSASSNNLTVTRAVDMSGASAQDHSAGAVVRHMIIGRDLREANLHIEATGGYNDGTGAHTLHGLAVADGAVVGTDAVQTLTNKTLTSPVLTGTLENDASITFEGATADAYETTLTVVDPTADRTITLPNATGTVVLKDTTDTLTNKTLTSPTISGSPVITGLSSAGMSASSAAPKDYVDSILGSATAASTSAASAATSASSAATSASSSLTSANSAATSATDSAASAATATTQATAATTSATSAAASATAAATSATSAAASATAAATSASSAATSATSAAASVSSIAGYSTTASNSASAAATSASSAATSASSAATSASDAATTYDNFDDRYLGNKSSAPTVDNDGNTLLVGAIYWNSTANNMYVWSGTAWVQIATTSIYSAPTLGSQSIASGTTYTNIAGLTINSTTIPSSKTLVVTTDKLSTLAATTSAELAGVVSDETGTGSLVFGTSPTISNPVINNFVLGYSTTVTAAGTTTLTNSSNNQQLFTGTTTQTVVMPVASTMTVGTRYLIENNSTGVVTVQSSGLNTIATIPSLTTIKVTSILNTGTTAASWDYEYVGFGALTGTGSAVLATAPTISNLTLSGTLTATATSGTSGQVLQSTGTGVQWGTVSSDPTPTVFLLMGA
jgi:hypothetical protein